MKNYCIVVLLSIPFVMMEGAQQPKKRAALDVQPVPTVCVQSSSLTNSNPIAIKRKSHKGNRRISRSPSRSPEICLAFSPPVYFADEGTGSKIQAVSPSAYLAYFTVGSSQQAVSPYESGR